MLKTYIGEEYAILTIAKPKKKLKNYLKEIE